MANRTVSQSKPSEIQTLWDRVSDNVVAVTLGSSMAVLTGIGGSAHQRGRFGSAPYENGWGCLFNGRRCHCWYDTRCRP